MLALVCEYEIAFILFALQAVKVFAGVSYDESGKSIPTTTGRLCQWMENDKQPSESFTSYGAYQRSLSLRCDEGHSGKSQ